jgi:hypothetical protein
MSLPPDSAKRAALAIALGERGARHGLLRQVRGLMLGALRHPVETAKMLRNMSEVEQRHQAMTRAWTPAAELAQAGGSFNALDLGCWTNLAAASGVPHVPVREVLRLSMAELSAISGAVRLDALVAPSMETRVTRLGEFLKAENPVTPEATDDNDQGEEEAIDIAAVRERLFAAMDDVPENWMVRSSLTGPETLKTLVGIGAIGTRAPEIRMGEHFWIGPGWVRVGNRRAVDAGNQRLAAAHMEGDQDADMVFFARPWMPPSRQLTGIDPHTRGTPLQAEGKWPAEWRAFIYNGEVTGVSAYYAWAGEATPEAARQALAVRDLAQRLVDRAVAAPTVPQFMSIEHARHGKLGAHAASFLPAGGFHATLDFLETYDEAGHPALLLLEGGPPFDPCLPGGHPCAFAGIARPQGVAFRPMDGVRLEDQATWSSKIRLENEQDYPGLDPSGAIFTWDGVATLAAQEDLPVP